MAENKTRATTVDVQAYLEEIPDEARRSDAVALMRLMKKVTGVEPVMWGPSIVGFDRHHYVYESGREGDMPIVSFSPRKAALTVYGVTSTAGSDELLAALGKHTTGKGCLYIKRMADVNAKVLETLVKNAAAAKRAKQAH